MSRRAKRAVDKRSHSEDFSFNPSDLDLKFSRNLITVLDGYRIHRTYDLGFIDRAVGKGNLPRSFITQWSYIRSVLHKLAAIGPNVQGVESWLNKKQYVSFASMASLTIVAPILLLTWIFRWEFLTPLLLPLAAIAIAMVLINWLTSAYFNRQVAWAIHNYVESNPELVGKERKQIKEWVQLLIDHVERLIRKSGTDPDKTLTKFFNTDYRGIEVLKEPKGLRKHYVVKFVL